MVALPLSSLDTLKLEFPVKVEVVKVEADSDFEPKVLIAAADLPRSLQPAQQPPLQPVTIADRSRDPRNRAVRPINSKDPRLNR